LSDFSVSQKAITSASFSNSIAKVATIGIAVVPLDGAKKSPTRPFQVLALKRFSVDQLAIWPFNYLNSAVLPAL
jgi:hypothetical protein